MKNLESNRICGPCQSRIGNVFRRRLGWRDFEISSERAEPVDHIDPCALQLELQHVSYRLGEKSILKNVSAGFSAGDYVSIVGPSGGGKSTFLKLCCHLISPTTGQVRLYGRDMMCQDPLELRKKVAYCSQLPILFGDTVQDNFAFPYEIRHRTMDKDRIRDLLSRFQMGESYLTQAVKTLSGGEKQRIALIRTLLFKPEILLLDEVTSALDTENADIVEDIIS